MAAVGEVFFENWNHELQRVDLLHPDRVPKSNFETTIITGQNGSNKSTLLSQLVGSLARGTASGESAHPFNENLNPDGHQVFCISGSSSDRFPQKELPGGKRSPVDVPSYTYVGQRVGNNLLSRKAPLETMLAFALMPRAAERCGRQFFIDAHTHAGIYPSVLYTLRLRNIVRNSNYRAAIEDLLGEVRRITPADDELGYSKRRNQNLSYAMAQQILSEYSPEEFGLLQEILLNRKPSRYLLTLDTTGARCENISSSTLRLGLLLDVFQLESVEVTAVKSDAKFSVFELSSGEYHMFSTILALGLGLDKKCVLLIDEPENNLHPQWQRDLMGTVFDVCGEVVTDGHIIVCTHSPLVVATAPEGSTIVDMTSEDSHMSVASYGASADELLLAQFGVASSRNRVVVDTVQKAVSFIERGDFDNPSLEALTPELRNIRNALTPTDPMITVIDALLDDETSR
jgi:predicted ATPase